MRVVPPAILPVLLVLAALLPAAPAEAAETRRRARPAVPVAVSEPAAPKGRVIVTMSRGAAPQVRPLGDLYGLGAAGQPIMGPATLGTSPVLGGGRLDRVVYSYNGALWSSRGPGRPGRPFAPRGTAGAPTELAEAGPGGSAANWHAGLAPASGGQRGCPAGTAPTLARGHADVVRCLPL